MKNSWYFSSILFMNYCTLKTESRKVANFSHAICNFYAQVTIKLRFDSKSKQIFELSKFYRVSLPAASLLLLFFRFRMRSTLTGFIASCYDLAQCVFVILLTYSAGRVFKPKWIGWGVMIMGVGSIMFSLPHFIVPGYTVEEYHPNTCDSPFNPKSCEPTHIKTFM